MKATQVAKQIVGGHVVGDIEVDAVVVIEVGGHDAQSAAAGVNEAGLLGHVDEPPAVIAEDVIGKRREVARAAVVIATRLLVGSQIVGFSRSKTR